MEVLEQYDLKLKDEHKENIFMVIAKDDMMSRESVDIIRRIKMNHKVLILNSDKLTYYDYRGEEYEFALFLVKEAGLPVLLECLSGWITNKIQSYKARAAANQKTPKISLDIIRTEKFEKITIEAEEVETVLKILKELCDQYESK